MNDMPRHLVELVGSRICHDLISPLGAISNGVELISMNNGAMGPEMSLISQSVENANARIKFFRIAYGAARRGQKVSFSDVRAILQDLSRGGRMVFDWQCDDEMERTDVKLVFLLLQCFETAMPWGGKITISVVGEQWAIYGQADQMKIDPDLWQTLSTPGQATDLQPANVQFALAPVTATAIDRRLTVESSENSARVRF